MRNAIRTITEILSWNTKNKKIGLHGPASYSTKT